MKMGIKIPLLPPDQDIETKSVMRQLAASHRYLALLNGKSATIPNENILLNTLVLQEAKESSAIENIITSHDELYKAELFDSYFNDPAAKEVSRYADALKEGFRQIRNKVPITNNLIKATQQALEQNDAGYRRTPGTVLKNERTGEIVYTPPQDYRTIEYLMDNLVQFINDEAMSDLDPLIKMAIMHHRFETIHPFYDGNGRTGRIVNVLYLVQEDLLSLPILYLSRYIIQFKSDYYYLLQHTRESNNWEEWLLFMLKGVEETAKQTLHLIDGVKQLMQDYKQIIRTNFPKIYSQDLLNILFKHPYTKIDFLVSELNVDRRTAASYLNKLSDYSLLRKTKIGKSNFYINTPLFNLFAEGVPPAQAVEPIRTVTE